MSNDQKVIAILPARLESSRLPRKALKDICGLPMIVHVFKRCLLSKKLDEVYVATDSLEIKEVVEKYGGKVIMTSSKHETGTDRIAEAALELDVDIIVNIQGDEALVNPEYIDRVANELIENPDINVLIEGHTDNISDDKHNLILSDNRAAKVYGYLVDRGVSSERLSYKGYGETVLKDIKNGLSAENRRIEFKIKKISYQTNFEKNSSVISRSDKIIREEKNGYEARILQHEIDHLSGKLFVDYLSSLKRNMLLKKVKKLKKLGKI